MASCKTKCIAKLAWAKDGTTSLPIAEVTGAAYCFGIESKANVCKFVTAGFATLAAGVGSDSATTCVKRTKSVKGSAYITALNKAKTGASLHDAYNTKLTDW